MLKAINKILNYISVLSEKWWGQLFLVAWPIMVIFTSVFICGQVFVQPDVLNYFYPTIFSYGQAVRNNISPFWDPLTLSGFPVFINSALFFSPFTYIFFGWFNFLISFHVLLAVNFILSGFFTVRFIKKLGASGAAAIIGGLAYVISIQGSLGVDLPLVAAGPILPLLFLVLLADYRKNRWWLVVLGGILVGFAGLGVHINWFFIILSGGFVFSLGLSWIHHDTSFRQYLKTVFRYLIVVAIGGLIGLIQYFPVIIFTFLNSRWGGLNYSLSLAESVKPLDLASFIFPSFSLPFLTSFPFLYFGVLPLIFLIVAFFVKSRLNRFFIILFVLCFLLSVWHSPLFWLFNKLPIFEYFRSPSRWLFLGFFAVSISVAFGADSFLTSSDKVKKNIASFFAGLIIVITGISVVSSIILFFFKTKILDLIKNYFDSRLYAKTTGLPLEHYHQIIDNFFNLMTNLFSPLNPHFFLPFISLLVGFGAVWFFIKNKNQAVIFLPTIVFLVGLNFIVNFSFDTPVLSVVNRDVFNYKSQTAQFILKNPSKIFSFLPGFTLYNILTVPFKPNQEDIFQLESELMTPKINVFYGVASADGFDSMMVKRYAEIIALLGSDRAVTGEKIADLRIPLEAKIKLFNERHNLLDMMGIGYIISGYDLESNDLKKVFETKATKYQIPVYVYENTDYLPLFFLVKNVKYLNPLDDNYKIITDNKNNFNKTTFIECVDCKINSSSTGEIRKIEHNNGHLKLETHTSADAWLVFNESNLPGWKATIDGQVVKIYPANYIFQSILVPAGKHEIIFNYSYFEVIKYPFKK